MKDVYALARSGCQDEFLQGLIACVEVGPELRSDVHPAASSRGSSAKTNRASAVSFPSLEGIDDPLSPASSNHGDSEDDACITAMVCRFREKFVRPRCANTW